jgi:phosphinothricin acetyltransferase
MIRAATSEDAAAIATIYNHYVEHTVITFEEETVPVAAMAERITQVTVAYPWLVDETDGQMRGYAYATQWRPRASYRLSAESTIYLAPGETNRGLGTALYRMLLEALRAAGLHCVLGGIALPNPASVALHEKLGFRKVGHLLQVGRKFDTWIDVGYWQKSFSPPSPPATV